MRAVRLSACSLLLLSCLLITSCQNTPESPPQDRNTVEYGRQQDSERGIGGSGMVADNERGIGGSGRQQDSERGIGGSGMVADNERGIGGSGRQQDSERGIGGSGIVADNERGIGGSGRQQDSERGIGGSEVMAELTEEQRIGVVGTITRFGSVWVNGLHIFYDQQTLMQLDAAPTTAAALRLGQRAVITASLRGGKLYADTLELIHEVKGPVSQVDTVQRRIRVLNQQIEVPETIDLPQAGEWLAVSGVRSGAQTIQATRLDRIDSQTTATPQNSVLLRGQLQYQRNSLQVSGQPFSTHIQQLTLPENSFVILRGTLINGRIEASSVQRPQRFDQHNDIRIVSVERPPALQHMPGPYTPVPKADTQLQVIPHWQPAARPASQAVQDGAGPQQAKPQQDTGTDTPQDTHRHQGAATQPGMLITPQPQPSAPRPTAERFNEKPLAPAERPAALDQRLRSLPSIRPVNIDRVERPATPERPVTIDRPERPTAPERPVTIDRPERPAAPERPVTIDRPERPTAPERPVTIERPARPQGR